MVLYYQVPMVPTGPKPRVQRIVASSAGLISTSAGHGMVVSSVGTLMPPGIVQPHYFKNNFIMYFVNIE